MREREKIMLIGIGELGGIVLEFLCRIPGICEIVTADNNADYGFKKTNSARIGAAFAGLYPNIKFHHVDLINIEKFTAYAKLLIDNTASRPFSMATIWPLPGIKMEDMGSHIKSLSRLKYGRDRELIEAEIYKRTHII